MRIMIKGGLWKNIEDEILKAAIMKYGLNQWSRISSLLVRKSAKQCKARWYEWLDPSIKKTEWSKAEEEKLLHLAKLFPNQWRTIAPGIGRTPAQCLEHYEKLLEEAAGKLYDTENDPRRLRPGEVDPCPETRAPRPDPVDMDEDEKEMLQEARARLSNTRGKKAKRKMREKQLEEGRRLATVQRKRELRASGIEMELKKRIKPKVREMNYNVEIPFEHLVPQGKFEKDRDLLSTRDELMISAQHIEGSMRAEQEAKKKLEDERKMKRMKDLNLPAAIEKINSLNEVKVPIKRKKLELPKARFSEGEIYELVKVTNNETGAVTDLLVENKATVEALVNQIDPHRETSENSVMMEAYNAYWRSNSATPLVPHDQPERFQISENFKRPSSVLPAAKPEPEELEMPEPIKRPAIKSYLDLLPTPENDYELEESSSNESSDSKDESSEEEQAVGIDSSAVQRKLPRPYVFNPKHYLKGSDDPVRNEVTSLVLYDMHKFPMKGAKTLKFCVDKELIDNHSMNVVNNLIRNEIIQKDLDLKSLHKDYIFSFQKKQGISSSSASFEDLLFNAKMNIKYNSAKIEKILKKNKEMSEVILTKCQDFVEKQKKLETGIRKKQTKLLEKKFENELYESLRTNENVALANRLDFWTHKVNELERQESAAIETLNSLTSKISAWEWCRSLN